MNIFTISLLCLVAAAFSVDAVRTKHIRQSESQTAILQANVDARFIPSPRDIFLEVAIGVSEMILRVVNTQVRQTIKSDITACVAKNGKAKKWIIAEGSKCPDGSTPATYKLDPLDLTASAKPRIVPIHGHEQCLDFRILFGDKIEEHSKQCQGISVVAEGGCTSLSGMSNFKADQIPRYEMFTRHYHNPPGPDKQVDNLYLAGTVPELTLKGCAFSVKEKVSGLGVALKADKPIVVGESQVNIHLEFSEIKYSEIMKKILPRFCNGQGVIDLLLDSLQVELLDERTYGNTDSTAFTIPKITTPSWSLDTDKKGVKQLFTSAGDAFTEITKQITKVLQTQIAPAQENIREILVDTANQFMADNFKLLRANKWASAKLDEIFGDVGAKMFTKNLFAKSQSAACTVVEFYHHIKQGLETLHKIAKDAIRFGKSVWNAFKGLFSFKETRAKALVRREQLHQIEHLHQNARFTHTQHLRQSARQMVVSDAQLQRNVATFSNHDVVWIFNFLFQLSLPVVRSLLKAELQSDFSACVYPNGKAKKWISEYSPCPKGSSKATYKLDPMDLTATARPRIVPIHKHEQCLDPRILFADNIEDDPECKGTTVVAEGGCKSLHGVQYFELGELKFAGGGTLLKPDYTVTMEAKFPALKLRGCAFSAHDKLTSLGFAIKADGDILVNEFSAKVQMKISEVDFMQILEKIVPVFCKGESITMMLLESLKVEMVDLTFDIPEITTPTWSRDQEVLESIGATEMFDTAAAVTMISQGISNVLRTHVKPAEKEIQESVKNAINEFMKDNFKALRENKEMIAKIDELINDVAAKKTLGALKVLKGAACPVAIVVDNIVKAIKKGAEDFAAWLRDVFNPEQRKEIEKMKMEHFAMVKKMRDEHIAALHAKKHVVVKKLRDEHIAELHAKYHAVVKKLKAQAEAN